MAVLTKQELITLDFIKRYDKDCFAPASYDLRLGNDYSLPNDSEILNPHKISCPFKNPDKKNNIEECAKTNYVLIIKPFTSVIFSTEESLVMPNNIAGRFDLKIRWALQGLILQVGTQIEPGYKGKLFGLLHNLSKENICIPTNAKILTAEFFTLTGPVESEIKKDGGNLKDFLEKRPVVKGSLEDYLTKVKLMHEEAENNIAKKTKEIDTLHKNIMQASNFKGTVIIAFVVCMLSIILPVLITKFTYDRDDYPNKEIEDLRKGINELESTIEINKSKSEAEVRYYQEKLDYFLKEQEKENKVK